MRSTGRSDHLTRAYGQWLLRRRWLVIAATALVSVAAAWGAQFLVFENDYRIYFGQNNPQLQAFEEIQNTYTKQDNILFVIEPEGGGVFTPQVLQAVQQLTDAAWRLPFAIRVDSITNFQHTRAEGDDLLVGDLVEDPAGLSQAALASVRETALAEPVLRDRLIAADGSVTGVMVTFQLPGKALDEVTIAASAARGLAERTQAEHPSLTLRLTGAVMMSNAFFESAVDDLQTLLPIMYAIVVLAMWVLLRSVAATLATVAIIALSITTAMGLAGWAGIELNSSSAAAPTVIMTLAVADCIHLLLTLFAQMRRGLDKEAAIVESLRINMQPVFLTSITTAIGFLTMNFSDAPPFHDLGNIVAVGVMAAFVYAVVLLPALMAVLPARSSRTTGYYALAMGGVAEFVIRRQRPVLIGSVLVAIAIMAFIPRNELNDEFIKYFGEDIAFRRDTDFTLERLTGLQQVHYSIPAGDSNGIADPQFLEKLDRFAEWYRAQPETVHVSAITDTFKRLNQNLHGDDPARHRLPEDRALAAQYLLLYELSLPYGLDLNNQVNVDKSATQLVATVRNLGSVPLRELVSRSELWLREHAPEMATHGIGVAVMFAHISERNIKSMLTGTLLGLVLISAILVVALRSVRMGLVSLAPNLLPAGLTFGLWGLAVGQVNVAVSVVTALSLGIVVDDTVHFLSKYLRARREQGLATEDAVRYAFSHVGMALVATTLILVAGFLVLSQSSFAVNAITARLTAIAIALALVVDFLLLPALLLGLDRGDTPVAARTENGNETALATQN